MTRFATATRDELWFDGRLLERRVGHGEAMETADGIIATDTRDATLAMRCDALIEQLRNCVLPDVRMRLVAEVSTEGKSQTITITHGGHSIVTTPEHIASDIDLLRSAAVTPVERAPSRPLPLLWKNGTAAVLLHEALGHPREHGQRELDWPQWLVVEAPLTKRRATFRDVPLLRMTTLTAKQIDAPFDLPHERIEVALVDGGSYEPLTELVSVRIAAASIGGVAIEPFTIACTRDEVVRAVAGAQGDPVRYPGVICSREGQELVVGSLAPELLTVFS